MHGEIISQNARKTILQQRAAARNGAARRGAYLGGGKMVDGVGRNVYGVGKFGSGSHSWNLCAFPFILFSCPQKLRSGNCDRG